MWIPYNKSGRRKHRRKGFSTSGLTRQVVDIQDPGVNPNGKVVIGVSGKKLQTCKKGVENTGGLAGRQENIDGIFDTITLD